MNRKAEIFFDAITLLPEDMIEEAQEYRLRKNRTSWKRFASLAACLMLVASLSLLFPRRQRPAPRRGYAGRRPPGRPRLFRNGPRRGR